MTASSARARDRASPPSRLDGNDQLHGLPHGASGGICRVGAPRRLMRVPHVYEGAIFRMVE